MSVPQQPQYQQAPVAQTFNPLAIVSFVLAFFVSLGAIICGHIALGQIKRTGQRGRALAIWGLVLGYLGIVLGIVWVVAVVAAVAAHSS